MSKQKEEQSYATKYDKKIAERELEKKKDAKNLKITKIVVVLVAIAVLAAIIIPITVSSAKKNKEINQVFMKINDYEMTQLEYDYYYNTTVNNFLNSYGSFVQYMNLDVTKNFAEQVYKDNLTWQDYFDKNTVEQVKQIRALLDDAEKNGFTYDATERYDTYLSSVKEAAKSAGITVDEYYRTYFGQYATTSNVEKFIKDGIVANAYYQKLVEDQNISADEIQKYYEENKNSYDQVDYKKAVFSSDMDEEATEEEKTIDEESRLEKANALLDTVKEGDDSELELVSGDKLITAPTAISSWLFDESRKEGDVEVLSDGTSSDVYVVEFVKRYYDETNNDTISQTLATQKASEYAFALTDEYTVTDVKGSLRYLTIPEATASTDEAEEEATEEVTTEEEAAEEATDTEEVTE